jgi:methyl-accepting chemotaxis protein
MRLTIGTRITTGFVLGILFPILLAITSYYSTKRLVDAAWWREHTHQVLRNVDAMTSALVEMEDAQRGYALVGDDAYLAPRHAAQARLDDAVRQVRSLTVDNVRQQERLTILDGLLSERLARLDEVIAIRRDKGLDAAKQAVAANVGRETMDQIRRILAEMSDEELRLLKERERATDDSISTANVTLWGTCGAAVVCLMVVSYYLTRSITDPLRALVAGAEQIGAGGFNHRIEVRGSDELAGLATAFNRMSERRQEADEEISAHVAERQKVLDAVKDVVQKLASSSQELLAGATQQAAGTQQQAAAVAETVTAVDEVTHTSAQAAERARTAAAAARRSEEIGRVGRSAIDQVVSIIGAAKGHSDEIAGKIASLAEQTQAVGEIVAVITDVAEQTNILALNAAIEASRAGEQGRGFSVVASEVKVLAEESKKATHRVRQILNDIQRMANAAVLSTEEGTRSMSSATKATAAAGETIESLEAVIVEVAEAASQIAASASQQATGLSQIHQAMRDIGQVSTQNFAATHQAQTAASELATMGSTLKSLLAS